MKTLLLDDHPVWRNGVALILSQRFPDLEILHASCCAEALTHAQGPGALCLALIDLNLRGESGLDAARALRATQAAVRILVFSASESPDDIRRSFSAGALGYLPKCADHLQIEEGLRTVLNGGVYVPPQFLGQVSSHPLGSSDEVAGCAGQLTARQHEVLILICKGLPNKAIGNVLGMAEKTVKTHVGSIFRALGVANRTQAVLAAQQLGWSGEH